MILSIEKTNTISNLESWFTFASPEGGKSQWVDGRSAKEFARYMLHDKGKLPKELENYFKEIGFKMSNCKCLPETVTTFPSEYGSGSGRHHDALLVSDQEVVGIEAKVSESFDLYIDEWLEKGESNADQGENRRKRIKESFKLIAGRTFSDKDLKSEELKKIRYQLVSATVGTIIEASVAKACLLIIEFGGDVTNAKEEDIERNARDYDNYLEFIGLKDRASKERYITVNHPKDGHEVKIWFNKIHIDITGPTYSAT